MQFFFFAGGGVALLYAAKELDKLETANFDQKIGVQIIQNALKVCLLPLSLLLKSRIQLLGNRVVQLKCDAHFWKVS